MDMLAKPFWAQQRVIVQAAVLREFLAVECANHKEVMVVHVIVPHNALARVHAKGDIVVRLDRHIVTEVAEIL